MTHLASCFARNATYQPSQESAKEAHELLEAIHEIPSILMQWNEFSLEEIRLHLKCFDHTRWPESRNLLAMFDNLLAEEFQK